MITQKSAKMYVIESKIIRIQSNGGGQEKKRVKNGANLL
jgi:hypothetical protein